MAEQPIFDQVLWEHERDHSDDTRAAIQASLGHSPPEERRRRISAERASQGDRIDWRRHLFVGVPKGYRVVANEELSHGSKNRRTLSLKAAAERRGRLRSGGGTLVRQEAMHRSASRHRPPILTFPQERWLDGHRPLHWFAQ